MRISSRIVLAAIVLLAATGCAHRIDTIGVDNPESTLSLDRGSKVSVMKLPSKPPFEHDRALERKMTELLEDGGYRVTEAASADYLLLYEYRISDRMAHMSLELLQGGREGIHTVRRSGPYTHTLELRVMDAPLFRQENYRDAMVWQGGAVLGDVPTDSPKFHDLVILAAFEQLGKHTEDPVTVRMSLNNSAAQELRH